MIKITSVFRIAAERGRSTTAQAANHRPVRCARRSTRIAAKRRHFHLRRLYGRPRGLFDPFGAHPGGVGALNPDGTVQCGGEQGGGSSLDVPIRGAHFPHRRLPPRRFARPCPPTCIHSLTTTPISSTNPTRRIQLVDDRATRRHNSPRIPIEEKKYRTKYIT